jgi:hypothetical protein
VKITRTRTQRFNMGAYEHLETSATVEFDTAEYDVDNEEEATECADGMLNALLQPDVDRADQTSRTPEDGTYVHAWKDSL